MARVEKVKQESKTRDIIEQGQKIENIIDGNSKTPETHNDNDYNEIADILAESSMIDRG